MEHEIKFRVYWIPQVPMKPFIAEVPTLEAGYRLCDTLGQYDLFQYENNIKPDYCNAGGVEFLHPKNNNGEWDCAPDEDNPDEWEAILKEIERAVAA